MISKVLFSTYYLMMSLIVYRFHSEIYKIDYNKQEITWLNIFSTGIKLNTLLVESIFFLIIFSCLITIKYNGRFIRIFICALLYTFFSYLYSMGKISHSNHIWLISSMFFCFIRTKESIDSPINLRVIRLCQTMALSHYFFAGLWKLRNLSLNFEFMKNTALEHIAFAIAEGNFPSNFMIVYFLNNYQWVLGIGFVLTIFIQLSVIIPIFLNKYYFFYGLLMILFHQMTGIVLGIGFSHTVFGLVYFFLLVEIAFFLNNKKILNYNIKL